VESLEKTIAFLCEFKVILCNYRYFGSAVLISEPDLVVLICDKVHECVPTAGIDIGLCLAVIIVE
jgi:hypothetical protein